MGYKTVIVILGVAALLLGYIFFFEKDQMTTSQRLEREERVFSEFRRDFVGTLTIEGTGGTVVELKRVEGAPDQIERFEIVSPRSLDADEGEVTAIISALDHLIAKRTIKGEAERKKDRYGFAAPRLKGSFVIRGETTSFVVGADAGSEELYLSVNGIDDAFFVVDSSFLESVDKSAGDLRSKKLIREDPEKSERIEVSEGRGGYTLRIGDGGSWQIDVGGNFVLAAAAKVKELQRTLANLKAEKFVRDGATGEDLSKFGLGKDGGEVRLKLKDEKPVVLRIGSPCAVAAKDAGEGAGEKSGVHVTVLDSGVIACVADESLEEMMGPASRFKESRPTNFVEADVTKITLTAGSKELVIVLGEEGFALADDPSYPVDGEAVSDLLGALGKTESLDVRVGASLVKDLGTPRARVKLERLDGTELVLSIHEDGSPGKVALRRGEEAALLTFSDELLKQVRPRRLAFRKRVIVTGDEADVEGLSIAGPCPQELRKQDGVFKLVEPIEADADALGSRVLAEMLARVEPTRFVAESASMEHGFGNPFAVVTATFSGEKMVGDVKDRTATNRVVMELGARLEDGSRYGRIRGGDEVVFVVGDDYEKAVNHPLAARDMVRIDENGLERMRLVYGRETIEFNKRDETWTSDNRGNVDGTRVARILTDMGAMNAISAHSFGGCDRKDSPTLSLQLWNDGSAKEASDTFRVFEKTKDSQEDGYLACRNDQAVTFVLPARIVDELLELADS